MMVLVTSKAARQQGSKAARQRHATTHKQAAKQQLAAKQQSSQAIALHTQTLHSSDAVTSAAPRNQEPSLKSLATQCHSVFTMQSSLSKACQQLVCGLQDDPELADLWHRSNLVKGKYSTSALAPFGVRIGKSTIQGAGTGVYASRCFHKDEYIGACIGELRQRDKAEDTKYHFPVPKCNDIVFDATDKAKANFTR